MHEGLPIQASLDLTEATLEEGELPHGEFDDNGGGSAWVGWTAERSGAVTLRLEPASLEKHWILAVYAGSRLGFLETIATATGPGPSMTFNAEEGVPYQIAIAGAYATDRGVVQLHVQ